MPRKKSETGETGRVGVSNTEVQPTFTPVPGVKAGTELEQKKTPEIRELKANPREGDRLRRQAEVMRSGWDSDNPGIRSKRDPTKSPQEYWQSENAPWPQPIEAWFKPTQRSIHAKGGGGTLDPKDWKPRTNDNWVFYQKGWIKKPE